MRGVPRTYPSHRRSTPRMRQSRRAPTLPGRLRPPPRRSGRAPRQDHRHGRPGHAGDPAAVEPERGLRRARHAPHLRRHGAHLAVMAETRAQGGRRTWMPDELMVDGFDLVDRTGALRVPLIDAFWLPIFVSGARTLTLREAVGGSRRQGGVACDSRRVWPGSETATRPLPRRPRDRRLLRVGTLALPRTWRRMAEEPTTGRSTSVLAPP